MKGIVFTSLADMVEEHHGIELWNKALKVSKVDSGGVYTAGKTYSDSEFFSLVQVLQKELNADTDELIRSFGMYFFSVLIERHPYFYVNEPTFIGFLKSIKDVIHVEVKKLFEQTAVPRFSYESEFKSRLTMYYQSPRKLCMLAEGMIYAAADMYNVNIRLSHLQCMHKGNHRCEFLVEVKG